MKMEVPSDKTKKKRRTAEKSSKGSVVFYRGNPVRCQAPEACCMLCVRSRIQGGMCQNYTSKYTHMEAMNNY